MTARLGEDPVDPGGVVAVVLEARTPTTPALRILGAIAAAVVLGALALAQPAQGATGGLTYRDCFSADAGLVDPTNNCTFAADRSASADDTGFGTLRDIAVSPDGSSAYAVSLGDAAIVSFDRAADGSLAYSACFSADSDTGAANGCQSPPTTASLGVKTGLGGVSAVAISPDGASVYVTSEFDDAIARFDRLADGTLVYRDCLTGDSDVGAANSCSGPPTQTAGGSHTGFESLRDVVVSPDGTSVYAISNGDFAILSFGRGTDGALALAGCFTASTPTVGVNGCVGAQDQTATASGQTGFATLRALAISPDGNSVYAISRSNSAVLRWDRAADGSLTFRDCFTADNRIDGGTNNCSFADTLTGDGNNSGFDDLSSVAISPDSKSVYVTSEGDAAMLRFDRAAAGALTYRDCFSADANLAGGQPNNCALASTTAASGTDTGFDELHGAYVAADGHTVYAASPTDGSIVGFDRAADGSLTFGSCFTADVNVVPVTNGCTYATETAAEAADTGFDGGDGVIDFDRAFVTGSPDGRSLYGSFGFDGAVVRFDRVAAQCSNGIDDDGDGAIDFPADPGCASLGDEDESDDPVLPPVVDNPVPPGVAPPGLQPDESPDTEVVGTRLTGNKNQRQSERGGKGKITVVLKAFAAEPASVVASGRIKVHGSHRSFGLSQVQGSIEAAGHAAVLRLVPKHRRDNAKIFRLRGKGKRLRAKTVAKFSDAAGNSATERRTVRLKLRD